VNGVEFKEKRGDGFLSTGESRSINKGFGRRTSLTVRRKGAGKQILINLLRREGKERGVNRDSFQRSRKRGERQREHSSKKKEGWNEFRQVKAKGAVS